MKSYSKLYVAAFDAFNGVGVWIEVQVMRYGQPIFAPGVRNRYVAVDEKYSNYLIEWSGAS